MCGTSVKHQSHVNMGAFCLNVVKSQLSPVCRCLFALFGDRTETRSCSISLGRLLSTYLLGTVLRSRSPENENTSIIFTLTAFLSVGTIHYQSVESRYTLVLPYDIQKGLRALLLDCAHRYIYIGTFVPVLFTLNLAFQDSLANCSKRRGSAGCMHVYVQNYDLSSTA